MVVGHRTICMQPLSRTTATKRLSHLSMHRHIKRATVDKLEAGFPFWDDGIGGSNSGDGIRGKALASCCIPGQRWK